MTNRHKINETISAISGAVLIGLGLHILLGSLDRAASQWTHLIGDTGPDTLGVLPSVVLASSQVAQAYAVDHQFLFRMVLSFWPLFLVIAGTVLLRDVFSDKTKALPATNDYYLQKNTFKNENIACRFRSPSFDV